MLNGNYIRSRVRERGREGEEQRGRGHRS